MGCDELRRDAVAHVRAAWGIVVACTRSAALLCSALLREEMEDEDEDEVRAE